MFLSGCLLGFASGCSNSVEENLVSNEKIAAIEITSLPKQIDKNCRNGRAKIYDECNSQLELFAEARKLATVEDKTVLVSFGAEWCIWCHVFDAYIHGYVDKFTYTFGEEGNDARETHTMRERAKHDVSQEAYDLKKYVSDNFVVVHIDYEHASKGEEVLDIAEAWDNFENFIPYIFTVDAEGLFTGTFSHDEVEIRRDSLDWYRGYNRVALLKKLREMREASIRP